MSNRDTSAALEYHEATKLAYINLRNKPPMYKSYASGPVISLPEQFPHPSTPTLDALIPATGESAPSLELATLAQLLFFSAGVIRKSVVPSVGEVHYRAAASAGALYPIETYVVCKDIPGLEAGVYHFSPADFSLRQLRRGDYRSNLFQAAAGEDAIASAPVTLVYSSIFWRSAWKYRARGYRYCFWDNGTIAANLMATASAAGLPVRIIAGFVDEGVDRLVGIDGRQEATFCLAAIGANGTFAAEAILSDVPVLSQHQPLSFPDQIEYAETDQAHTAARLTTDAEAAAWRGPLAWEAPQAQEMRYTLDPLLPEGVEPAALGEVILRRGSTRRFRRQDIPLPHFKAILERSTRGVPADFLGPEGTSLLDLYIIVNAVEGLTPGAYVFSPQRRELELLAEGNFREDAGHLGFEQALSADASAVVFFMADLGRILARYGNRGYRAAQLEAGILGGRLYLATHSLGLGATGLTFYDDDVTDFFSPHAAGKSLMFVVALGATAERNQVRPFRSRVAVRLDALARGAGQGTG